ncbi:ABC transporter ATP-binding protein [Lysinibacter cavernae]|uniref:Iron complex transport system ATP-binding protein n=1 Tax=Lysinibacter cavernae TaxID=1640652 RepID=A0A7X5TRQ1_9MICO|nr:ATP-binding cassette domain-containing protein [Lysinibacter cavernae]NIH52491.1 iron complex transport system ATP-binding protein [Lysinibacter cavernae]
MTLQRSIISDSAPALELHDVSFVRNKRPILSDIKLTVEAGEHWAILGPNGAGKSTLLAMCGAVSHPTSGTVRVLGAQLGRVELQALRTHIGHVNPRHPLTSGLSIQEVVLTGLTGTIDRPMRWGPTDAQVRSADELIDLLGLAGKTESTWPTLSQGERGRALIARALIAEPQLLLLDEPSTGLDVAAREQLLETIDNLDSTHPHIASILVTHHLEELPTSTTHALLLSHGRITMQGPIQQTLTTDSISHCFEHPISVTQHDGRWTARAGKAASSPAA